MSTSTSGFCLAIAWPETQCKQAGGWYDSLLYRLGINKNGYYKVGHAALVLISDHDKRCRYYDFGRYHTAHGHGRVRSEITDHDLRLKSKARIEGGKLLNITEILTELFQHPSAHGDGPVKGSVARINHESCAQYIERLSIQDQIPYGPFIRPGTNCSRFVKDVLIAGKPRLVQRIRLHTPFTLTPSPMSNLRALGSKVHTFAEKQGHVVAQKISNTLVSR